MDPRPLFNNWIDADPPPIAATELAPDAEAIDAEANIAEAVYQTVYSPKGGYYYNVIKE